MSCRDFSGWNIISDHYKPWIVFESKQLPFENFEQITWSGRLEARFWRIYMNLNFPLGESNMLYLYGTNNIGKTLPQKLLTFGKGGQKEHKLLIAGGNDSTSGASKLVKTLFLYLY